MDKWFLVKFAYKNLRLRKLRTILTVTGMIIGISAIIFLVSFAYGIERLVTSEVTTGDAFLLIDVGSGNSEIVTLDGDQASSIKNISNVRDVYSMVAVGAMAKRDDRSMDISFYGIHPKYVEKSGMRISQGSSLSGGGNELLVNKTFMQFWNITDPDKMIGQTIPLDIVIPRERSEKEDNQKIFDQSFMAVGVINDNSSPKVYTNITQLEDLGVVNYSQFKVETDSQASVPKIRKQIETMGLKTEYVGDTVSQINQVFVIFKAVLAAFGFITLLVAILSMFNTLTISLLERIKEIALMKMLGMRKRDINRVFLTESIMLGLFGGILGLVLGIAAGKIANSFFNYYAVSMGGEAATVFYSPLGLIIAMVVLSFCIGLFTGLYPARRAVRVKALDVLRHE